MNLPQVNPPPSPHPPSGSSQCTSPKHPTSCIEPGLATRFIHDIIHVSMPFSQISPPSPSPTESIRLIYTSVSLSSLYHIHASCRGLKAKVVTAIKYWVGPKAHSDFTIKWNGKTQTNFLANAIFLCSLTITSLSWLLKLYNKSWSR